MDHLNAVVPDPAAYDGGNPAGAAEVCSQAYRREGPRKCFERAIDDHLRSEIAQQARKGPLLRQEDRELHAKRRDATYQIHDESVWPTHPLVGVRDEHAKGFAPIHP
jgi:hypothetical protein